MEAQNTKRVVTTMTAMVPKMYKYMLVADCAGIMAAKVGSFGPSEPDLVGLLPRKGNFLF